MIKNFFRILVNIFFGARRFQNRKIKKFAKTVQHKKILELGSGKLKDGEDYYSVRRYFNDNNEFIQSDINPDFGHMVVDVVTMDYKEEFDMILCLNVLEHVYEYPKAIQKLYDALRPGGTLVVLVPFMYPLHDEPADYWRFSEHALRKLCSNFKSFKLEHSGIRQFSIAYFAVMEK